ncbi:hypothetical protein RJ641_023681 [Dillenia turbinata]|uniref:Uncharacterized protein n=1 Tax=Dillenia turbinata TaxID=194707 RepID=A0AAN8U7F0_9MAGN
MGVGYRLSLALSLSFAAVYCSSQSFRNSSISFPKSVSSSRPKASTSDLLSLLSTRSQSSKVNPNIADSLKSCLKFLVPPSPIQVSEDFRKCSIKHRDIKEEKEGVVNELIWWPPESVLELARLALDSGGDPDAIHRALDPTVLPVPDVEGCKESRCQLTRTPYGRCFISEDLNAYLEFLFGTIVARGPSVGLNVSLSRYDLFHGHLFIATNSCRVGILFHAKEYPAYEKEIFPYDMGFCQTGSNVEYDDSMNLRNILWLAPLPGTSGKDWVAPGVLVVLDANPEGIVYSDLIPEYVRFARTMYEDDFGDVVVDVNYLNVGKLWPEYQIFIC